MSNRNIKLMEMPLKNRIIHTLAAQPTALEKIRLVKRLQQEGMEKGQGKQVSTILLDVGKNVGNKFTLKHSLWSDVQDNWPFYTEEEKLVVQNKKKMMMKQPHALDEKENRRSSDTDLFGVGVKRPNTEDIDTTAKRPRHGRKMYTGAKIPASTGGIHDTSADAGYYSSTSSKHTDFRQSSISPHVYAPDSGAQKQSSIFKDDQTQTNHGFVQADQIDDNLLDLLDGYENWEKDGVSSNDHLSPDVPSNTGRNSRNQFSNGPRHIRNRSLQSSLSTDMPSNNFVNGNHVSPNLVQPSPTHNRRNKNSNSALATTSQNEKTDEELQRVGEESFLRQFGVCDSEEERNDLKAGYDIAYQK